MLLTTAGEVIDVTQFSRTKRKKKQLVFQAAMPKNHNKVLLKKSLHAMYEGLNMVYMIKCSLKNRHLLRNEGSQRRKWYKSAMLDMEIS